MSHSICKIDSFHSFDYSLVLWETVLLFDSSRSWIVKCVYAWPVLSLCETHTIIVCILLQCFFSPFFLIHIFWVPPFYCSVLLSICSSMCWMLLNMSRYPLLECHAGQGSIKPLWRRTPHYLFYLYVCISVWRRRNCKYTVVSAKAAERLNDVS